MTLYELPEAYRALLDTIAEGELTPELEKELDLLDATLQGKVDNICRMVRQLDAETKVLEAEAQRLKYRAISRDNAARRLKDYLQQTLERLGTDKVKTDLFTARLWKSPPLVEWFGNVDQIPEAYRRVTVELSKTAVLEAWKEGRQLPEGLTVQANRFHLRIL